MMSEIQAFEDHLAKLIGRRYCIATGRGATALWLAYRCIASGRTNVLFPATVCLSPVFTAVCAEKRPVFSDVTHEQATIDPVEVEKILARDKNIGALVAVHLYGYSAPVDTLKEICDRTHTMLIEDLAQALGGTDKSGVPFGSMGDISIVSFGHTKIMDVGWGGALLTDDKRIERKARELLQQLPERPDSTTCFGEVYSELYYAITKGARTDKKFLQFFNFFPELFKPNYLYQISTEQARRISQTLDSLPREVDHRRKIADLYDSILRPVTGITSFERTKHGVPWRYSFRVDEKIRDNLLSRVRGAGYEISSWYPSVPDLILSDTPRTEKYPVSKSIEKEVVNLWVSRDYHPEKAHSLAKLIETQVSDK